MSDLPDDVRRLIGKNTDDVAVVIAQLVGQLDLTPDEETFAREQAGRVFDLLSGALVDAPSSALRARCATAAAVIAFKTVQVWAEHDESTD
jgi:hypothetical protein